MEYYLHWTTTFEISFSDMSSLPIQHYPFVLYPSTFNNNPGYSTLSPYIQQYLSPFNSYLKLHLCTTRPEALTCNFDCAAGLNGSLGVASLAFILSCSIRSDILDSQKLVETCKLVVCSTGNFNLFVIDRVNFVPCQIRNGADEEQ